jgi:PEP-CTERM motif
MNRKTSGAAAAVAVIVISVSLAPPAQAQLADTTLYIDETFSQSGPGAPTPITDPWYVSADAYVAAPGNFTSLSLAYPGPGSPQTPTYNPQPYGAEYRETLASGDYSSLSAVNTAFPFGTYTVTGTGGTSGPQSASFAYSANYIPSAVPTLTTASYDALQGMNAADALTVHFNSFTPAATASQGILELVNDASGKSIYLPFFAPSASSETIAAHTLQPGSEYTMYLFFQNYENTNSLTSSVPNSELFQTTTYLNFKTGTPSSVPEPATASLLLLGLGGLAALRRWRVRMFVQPFPAWPFDVCQKAPNLTLSS